MRRTASLLVAAVALTGCAVSDTEPDQADPRRVVVATHDSWAAPDALVAQFEAESGYDVTIVPSGDAGQLTNKLVLTVDNPIADAAYGVDNTFATRALDEGVFAKYRSGDLPTGEFDLGDELTPVDWGDVCVNIDDAWFDIEGLRPPRTLDDLIKPDYKDLFVAPGAASSSPGFAFLLATIGKFGKAGWKGYWKELMANGAKLTSGWTDAYTVDFTAGGGNGSRPIVLSYSSSPPFTIPPGGKKPTTSALLDTCFRQVEYAGVLSGAKNPEGAQAFVDFLVSKPFQESLPENMYVFPVNPKATLPDLWAKWATPTTKPITVDPDDIADMRKQWLTEWGDLTTR